MMNHHLPPMPHGQPMPPPRRQHDVPYSTAPPNVRSSPAYMGYHHPHPHTTGPMAPYGPPYQQQQQHQHWYPYHHMPHHPPPQAFQPFSPLIVSSHPRSQQPPPPVIPPPHSLPAQPSTASTTPLHSTFPSTPPPVVHGEAKADGTNNKTKPVYGADVHKSPNNTRAPGKPVSTQPDGFKETHTAVSLMREPFYPPVSSDIERLTEYITNPILLAPLALRP